MIVYVDVSRLYEVIIDVRMKANRLVLTDSRVSSIDDSIIG